jgi:hypothetical protein
LDHADANQAAHISLDSIAQGNATVRDAWLINDSCADEDCQILGGTLDRAWVGGKTVVAGNPLLAAESLIACKRISGAPKIFNSILRDLVEVSDSPVLVHVQLLDAVMVYGRVRLLGPWTLGGFARMHEGDWMRPPRTVKLEHACLTECIEDKIMIECRCRTRAWWLQHGPKFGRRNDWTEDQIEQTLEVIKNWQF